MRRRSRRSSGLADSSAHSRCCTLLLYGVKKATCGDRKWPVTWVGVAGFEPAASSSRTHVLYVQSAGGAPHLTAAASGGVARAGRRRAVAHWVSARLLSGLSAARD
jgi:hypothetical protein